MVRKMIGACFFAALGMVVVALAANASAGAKVADDKVPDIKEIMGKGHKGTDAYLAKIKTAATGEKWEDAQNYAKALALFGDNLGKNKPPKGEDASWEKLTKKYNENTKAVLKGTVDKDVKATTTALGAISKSCGECHKAHK
jgi:cytochrome c556